MDVVVVRTGGAGGAQVASKLLLMVWMAVQAERRAHNLLNEHDQT